MNLERVRIINKGVKKRGPVIYWMSRDQRVDYNWAMNYARDLSESSNNTLQVIFCFVPKFLGASERQYLFMIDGLKQVETKLRKLGIGFTLFERDPLKSISTFVENQGASTLVTDFSPIRIKKEWLSLLSDQLQIPIHEVDAHNIIPCWLTSNKQEYGAYTIRPKIKKFLNTFLDEPIALKKLSKTINLDQTNWDSVTKKLSIKPNLKIYSLKPGEEEAKKVTNYFLKKKLPNYYQNRNNPLIDAQSGLSPYLHFGQISAQQVAYDVTFSDSPQVSKDAYLEELIVRRELSDNFCNYNSHYDDTRGFPEWAKKTLNDHVNDPREYNYSLKEFELRETHDHLWNAAQKDMVLSGKMHGYLRMYWAKKILEWSSTAEEALSTAILLNDRYELDGRDPNGYTGCAWSIGGLHDRPWPERSIFGKIRYMSFSGTSKKFDVNAYIQKFEEIDVSGFKH